MATSGTTDFNLDIDEIIENLSRELVDKSEQVMILNQPEEV